MLRAIEYFLIKWTALSRTMSWAMLAIILGVTATAGWYASSRLKVDTDTSRMIDPNLDFQVAAAALKDAFPSLKNDVAIIVEAPTLDEAEAFTAELKRRLEARDEVFSSVFAPSADPFFLENGLLYLDEEELGERLDKLTKAAGLIENLVRSPNAGTLFTTLADNDALAEKADLGQDTLQDLYAELSVVTEATISGETRPFAWMGALDAAPPADGVYRRISYAAPVLDFSRLQPAKPALLALEEEISTLSQAFAGRVTTYVTGEPALRADELSAVTRGLGLSFGLSIILVAFLLLAAYRSLFLAVITLLSLIISIVLTGAFAAATVQELNLVSVAFTVLLIGLGLDFAIHLLLHYQERRAANRSTPAALRGAVHEVGAGLTLAAPTTAIGFFAFIPTRFDGIAQLGLIAGFGVIVAFLVAVTFLPAALGAFKQKTPRRSSSFVSGAFGVIERISIPISILMIGLGGWAVTLVPQARFDADPMSLRDPESQSVRGFEKLFEDENTVPYRLTRLVDSVEAINETNAIASSISSVRATRSLSDFIPSAQEDKLDRIDFAAGSLAFALGVQSDENAGVANETGATTLRQRLQSSYTDETGPALRLAKTLEQLEADPELMAKANAAIFAYWPLLKDRLFAQLNADYVESDALPSALKERYLSADGAYRVDLLPSEDVRERRALETFVKEVEVAFPDIAGGALQTQKAGQIISEAMLQATLIALSVITIFLWLLLRRFTDVLLMLFPIALAAILTAGAGVIFNVPFNYANVIVLPLILGIGVDSGIHLVMRHRHITSGESVFGTSTPSAVLFAALTTIASFGSLMLSPHKGTASMGQLLSIAIGFTLVCTLIVLPAAIRLMGGDVAQTERNRRHGHKTG